MAQYTGKDKRLAYLFEHGGGGGGGTELVEMTKEEYDDLPDTKLTDGVPRLITDYSEGGGSGGNIYDGEERVIGTWFDKPLYRKVIIFINPTNSAEIVHNIPNINEIVKVDTIAQLGAWFVNNNYYAASNDRFNCYFNKTKIAFLFSGTANYVKATFYYTKVGD